MMDKIQIKMVYILLKTWRSSSDKYIVPNPSASFLATFWPHSLLFLYTHSLIVWIPQDSLTCWLLILSIFVLPTIFLSTFISLAYNICLVIYVSAYIIIRNTVALYILDFVSFLIYLLLQTRSFKQPATLAAF